MEGSHESSYCHSRHVAPTRSVYAETILRGLSQPIIDFAARYKFIDQGFPASELIRKA